METGTLAIIKYCKQWGMSVYDAEDLILEIYAEGLENDVIERLKEAIVIQWNKKED